MYQVCSVCHPTKLPTLNYILKYENLATEEQQLIKHLNWSKIITHTAYNNVYNGKNKSRKKSSNVSKLYFATLTKHDILSLYEKYEPDFLLFNYTFSMDEWKSP